MTNPQSPSWSEVLVAQSCPTFCYPMDCSPPGSSVHGILQARILQWLPLPSPADLPNPGIKPRSPALQADSLPLSHQGSCLANIILNEKKKTTKSILFKIKKKTRTPTHTTFVQHSIGSPGHINKARKRNKNNPHWNEVKLSLLGMT